MKTKQKYRCIGLMSGTSLDGLDIVFCEFTTRDGTWSYRLIEGRTLPYPESWYNLLSGAYLMNGADLAEADHSYGRYLGAICRDFLSENGGDPSFIASHGHTVFHRPDQGYSLQIGNGHDIAAVTSIPVIYDFRSHDISLGGQGAPLVPAGDRYLFGDYDFCLNIGGFSNVSYENDRNERIAFDICPANTILNHLSKSLGHPYDHNGNLGRDGEILPGLLNDLNNLDYYLLPQPKSLGREFLEDLVLPLIAESKLATKDILRTVYEHIAIQVETALRIKKNGRVIATGGGAKNTFLMELLRSKCEHDIIVPDGLTVEFKEAIIFAFLGLLRMLGHTNCLASVTGASSDCSGGIIVWPGREEFKH